MPNIVKLFCFDRYVFVVDISSIPCYIALSNKSYGLIEIGAQINYGRRNQQ